MVVVHRRVYFPAVVISICSSIVGLHEEKLKQSLRVRNGACTVFAVVEGAWEEGMRQLSVYPTSFTRLLRLILSFQHGKKHWLLAAHAYVSMLFHIV